MNLQALVFCSDDKVLRVLRRVLSELEVRMEHCPEADNALRSLTRQRFEAVIVDCVEERTASQLLRSARSAPSNKRAVAVAILDGKQGVRSAFDFGAHFVLYKPISMERAKASFRAARALMKRERRRNVRVPVSIPVVLISYDGTRQQTVTTDLGEGGMAVESYLTQPDTNEPLRIYFTLPESHYKFECVGEVAWGNAGHSAGVRFVDVSPDAQEQLKAWLERQSADIETEDPPLPCRLAGISPGGCYLETDTPFPVRAKVVISLESPDGPVQANGAVRIMHAECGMGVEFKQASEEDGEAIAQLLHAAHVSVGAPLQLSVRPDGLEGGGPDTAERWAARGVYDPLLELFYSGIDLGPPAFLAALRKHIG